MSSEALAPEDVKEFIGDISPKEIEKAWTYFDLKEFAKDLQIKGRSKMQKPELAKEIYKKIN